MLDFHPLTFEGRLLLISRIAVSNLAGAMQSLCMRTVFTVATWQFLSS